jgi:small subunit ribosomal protein S9
MPDDERRGDEPQAEQDAPEEGAAGERPPEDAAQADEQEPSEEVAQPEGGDAEDAGPEDAEEPGAADAEEPGAADAEEPGAADAEEPGAAKPEEPGAAKAEEAGAAKPEEPGAAKPEEAGAADADAEKATKAAEEERAEKQARKKGKDGGEPEAIPGAHLEPDLVLEDETRAEETEAYPAVALEEPVPDDAQAETEPKPTAPEAEERPVPRTPMELAADARYQATGKRKTSVARVILRPGSGDYTVNGRTLEEYFPRVRLQRAARQPLETAGYTSNMDVFARIHGGGVAAQADALRHGVARALIEVDPALRVELKRRGLLTRDARVKERKKAGLKKARKRPQFSKR